MDLLCTRGKPSLHGEFQASHGYTERLLSQNKKTKRSKEPLPGFTQVEGD